MNFLIKVSVWGKSVKEKSGVSVMYKEIADSNVCAHTQTHTHRMFCMPAS